MPKPKKLNSFQYFMMDFKKQEERKGRIFPNGLKDVQNDAKCHNVWKNLSNKDKTYYKNKVKNCQIQVEIPNQTTNGNSVDQVLKELLQKEQFLNQMEQDILLILKEAKQNNSVQDLIFYVIHVNIFYSRIVNNQVEYCPAEIAIAEFSLSKGITRNYHKIVNSEIQLGYNSAATEYSRDTHQIPKNPSFGEKDYGVIFREICEFIKPGENNRQLPPLYTRYNVTNIRYPVEYVLRTLANFSQTLDYNFSLYSLEILYQNLYNINLNKNSNEIEFDNNIASLNLQNNPFDCYKILQCEYHQQIGGGTYCSQSYVQRWIYSMFPYICTFFGIHLTPGIHIPPENDNIEKTTELENYFKKITLYESKISHSEKTQLVPQNISENAII